MTSAAVLDAAPGGSPQQQQQLGRLHAAPGPFGGRVGVLLPLMLSGVHCACLISPASMPLRDPCSLAGAGCCMPGRRFRH